MTETTTHPPRRNSRWQLILLLVLFGAPVVASYVMYYMNWLPEGRSNRGELIDPVKAMPGFVAPTWNGDQFRLSSLEDKWVMLSIAEGQCDQVCKDSLYTMRQVRKAIGKLSGTIERVLLLDASTPPANRAALAEEFAGTHFLLVDQQVRDKWLPLFANDQPLHGQIFYIDPRDNLMMRYQPGQEPKDLFEDLDTLLSATGFH